MSSWPNVKLAKCQVGQMTYHLEEYHSICKIWRKQMANCKRQLGHVLTIDKNPSWQNVSAPLNSPKHAV